MTDILRACYSFIGRSTIELAYGDLLSSNEKDFASAVRFFKNRDHLSQICEAAELDVDITYKGYLKFMDIRKKAREGDTKHDLNRKVVPQEFAAEKMAECGQYPAKPHLRIFLNGEPCGWAMNISDAYRLTGSNKNVVSKAIDHHMTRDGFTFTSTPGWRRNHINNLVVVRIYQNGKMVFKARGYTEAAQFAKLQMSTIQSLAKSGKKSKNGFTFRTKVTGGSSEISKQGRAHRTSGGSSVSDSGTPLSVRRIQKGSRQAEKGGAGCQIVSV